MVMNTTRNKPEQNTIKGHVHEYEAELWTLRKSEKVTFCYKIVNFSF